jgi:hypothetical protein
MPPQNSKFDTRQTLNHAALPGIGSAANTDLDVILGDINAIFAAATSAPTASVIMKRDANSNTQVNNLIENGQEVVTSGTTTILVVGSPYTNIFTGTSTQTVQLPAANTLILNQQFLVINNSTQSITVTNNGGSTIQTMVTGSQAIFTVTNIGSANGTWSSAYSTGSAGGTVTSVTFTGDGVLLSNTPSTPVTTSGTLTATLNTQASNTYFGGSDIAGVIANPTFKSFLAATVQQFGGGSSGTYVPTYTFQATSAVSVTAGARYTWNGIDYLTVSVSLTSSNVFYLTASAQYGVPASGSLTIHSGDTGPSSLSYSSWSNSPLYIRIEMLGAGGAGAAYQGGQPGAPGSGTSSTFTVINTITESSLGTLTAGGGGGATNTSNGYTQGGSAGVPSVSGSTSITGIIVPGNPGSSAASPLGNGTGGNGGASMWGGAGKGGAYNSGPVAGTAGASPGAGGGGYSGASGSNGGGGGGSGAWFDVLLYNPWPAGSFYGYPYSMGTGGVNASAGTCDGAGGFLRITEYYQ